MDTLYSPKECGKLIGRATNTLQKGTAREKKAMKEAALRTEEDD
jgi:hypothetical protein